MKRTFRAFAAPVALVAAVATLVGCQVPAISPGQASNIIKQAASYASLGLKMLDDAGIETGLDKSLISKLVVGGKEVEATYDADGNLQVPVAEAGGEQYVEVVLKDGQTVKMPLNAKKGEKFDAFLMSGSKDGELIGEVGARGAKPMDIFKDKTVLFEIGDPAITEQSVRAFYIASFKAPRQSWFVDGNNLRLHASNLWVLMQAKGAGQGPAAGGQQRPGGTQPMQPGGMQPGGMPPMQPPQPGGTQPPPPPPGGTQPPMFTLAQQPPPPGGTQPQQPPQGGSQPQAGSDADRKIVLRVAAEVAGKIKVWAFTPKVGVRLPGPPPPPEPGKPPVFKDLPTLKKADFDIESKEFASLEELEAAIGKKAGNFMPPPPPMRPAGQMQPGGMQPPPPGGTQPTPPGGTQPPPSGGTQPPPPGGTQPPPPGGTQPPR